MDEQETAIREFLAESYENLDQFEQDLVTLEADPHCRETVDRIFRTVHSIKGACGFLAYPRLETVAHAGEGLLCRMRDGELEWAPQITSALLALSDSMRRIMGHIEASGSEGTEDHAGLIDQLIRLQAQQTHVSAPVASPHPAEKQTWGHEPPGVPERSTELAPASPLSVEPDPATQEDWPGDGGKPAGSSTGRNSSSNIRVDVGLLDKLMNLVGELVLARNQILQRANAHQDASLQGTSQRLDLITTELQEGVMKTRMQPIGNIWSKFPRVVRDQALACGKQVRVELEGSETELDRSIIEAIKNPLTQLVRNAADHGIELPAERLRRGKDASGCLRMRAFHESGQVNIEIADDGAGIDIQRTTRRAVERGLTSRDQLARMSDHELGQLIFLPGFSTAEQITKTSGRDVGLDVVKACIEKIGGTIEVQSTAGQGTTFKIKIPLTLAIIPALIVSARRERFAIPQVNLLELVRLEGDQAQRGIELIHGTPIFRLRGSLLPVVSLERLLRGADAEGPAIGWGTHSEARNVDFSRLRAMHLRWKSRLLRFLDGMEEIVLEQLTSADQCELGQWLGRAGIRQLADRDEFAHLINIHKKLHDAVKDVVSLHQAGKRAAAFAALKQVESIATEIEDGLRGVERLLEAINLVNIVVLQADGRRFGLVVEGINDTEEIVVKPLGKQLKGVALFAGATIMGDGRVSLILDVAGIAQRAGLVSAVTKRLALDETKAQQKQKVEQSAFLLLRNGADGRVAVPLSLVARLEEIPCSAIEYSGGHEVVQYRNQIIPLVRLSEALRLHASGDSMGGDPMQVVVYTQQGQSVGLVVDAILDIVEDAIEMRPACAGRGLIGSAVIQERVTDVLDIPCLVRSVAPDLVFSSAGVGG